MPQAIVAINWTPGAEAPTFPQSVIDANGGRAPGYSVAIPIQSKDRRKTVLLWVDAPEAVLAILATQPGYVERLDAKDRTLAVDAKRKGDVAAFLASTAASAKPPDPIAKMDTVAELIAVLVKEHDGDMATYEAASAAVGVSPVGPTPEETLISFGWKTDGKLWTIEHEGKMFAVTMEEALALTREWTAEKAPIPGDLGPQGVRVVMDTEAPVSLAGIAKPVKARRR